MSKDNDKMKASDSPSQPSNPSEAARALGRLGASKGGTARAKKLTPEERSEIARRAVEARWAKAGKAPNPENVPRATHTGILQIGDIELPCAVLEGGTRVFNQGEFLKALGRSERPAGRRGGDDEQLPAFLVAKNLKPFISEELRESSRPIIFRPKSAETSGGGESEGLITLAHGYRVELLPQVCRVYLDARDAGVLMPGEQHGQKRIAQRCDLLIRALALVGITALVDEATGYQKDRPQDALVKILEQFISKELAKWVRVFPDDFYENLFRLRGWQYRPDSNRRPIHAAKLTNNLVYQRLAPGVLVELQRITPKDSKGRRKHKYHQRLTEDVGHPRLREHLASVITLMKASSRWSHFYTMLNRALPQYNVTKELPFPIEEEENEES